MIISDRPLVSIGIPFYNAEKYLIQTLESVKEQTYANIELLLVNDASPDESGLLVAKWLQLYKQRFVNVVLINNEINRGVAYSCKVLQTKASGKYFTKLDADDIYLPNKISEQVKYLETHSDVAMVYSNTLRIDHKGDRLIEDYFEKQLFATVGDGIGPSGKIFSQLLKEDFIPASSVLLRKSALDAAGGYDETLSIEDWDMWLRIALKFPIHFMKGYYSKYRIHPESMMQKKDSLVKVYASLIKALLKHRKISDEFDKIIARHIYTYAIGMYRFGDINKKYLKLNLIYNTSLKSLLYYILGYLNIKINQKAV